MIPTVENDVVRATNQFAFEMFPKLEDGNTFFSPWSIYAALAMTYEGARGETATEMQKVFSFPDSEVLRRDFACLHQTINATGVPYELNTANALWGQQGYNFLDDYLQAVQTYYGGSLSDVDFAGNAMAAADRINEWVNGQTRGKIPEIVSPDNFDSLTRLVLTNAIYFKGNWETEFDPRRTKEDDFHTDSGTVKVPMMELTKHNFLYAETPELQVLMMPYKQGDLSMIVVLPRDSEMPDMDSARFDELRNSFTYGGVNVYMPKFTMETSYTVSGVLENMGMPTAFIMGKADFSGMDGSHYLYISEILHKAYVDVNEEGTEAAAATASVMKYLGIPPPPVDFRVDHPFMFAIQHNKTGQVLFLGKVADPSKKRA